MDPKNYTIFIIVFFIIALFFIFYVKKEEFSYTFALDNQLCEAQCLEALNEANYIAEHNTNVSQCILDCLKMKKKN